MTSSSSPSITSTTKIGTLRSGKANAISISQPERLKDHTDRKAVVALLLAIEPLVATSAICTKASGLSCTFYCTPYPGFGNQPADSTQVAMTEIIPKLPSFSSD